MEMFPKIHVSCFIHKPVTPSQLDAIGTPPELTTDFFYLRLIGDRSINEKDFGRIQSDRQAELENWSKKVRSVKDRVKFGIVAANNHYAGFGPATANTFRKLNGLKAVVLDEMQQAKLG